MRAMSVTDAASSLAASDCLRFRLLGGEAERAAPVVAVTGGTLIDELEFASHYFTMQNSSKPYAHHKRHGLRYRLRRTPI